MKSIQSPLPGIFYHKPSPEDAPYKEAGDHVSKGDTIGLIEVMKTFIKVNAEKDGVFISYVVENAAPVQAGDFLAEVS